ncbi:MAG: hypothetical protein AB7U79_04400 [Candidatus Izemoplasmatales bacterium]
MNQFGDITHIITTSGTVAVEYKYDAFGNVVEVIGDANIANVNSFRYRSYVFDEETSLYIIDLCYYMPNVGRHITFTDSFAKLGDVLSMNGYSVVLEDYEISFSISDQIISYTKETTSVDLSVEKK